MMEKGRWEILKDIYIRWLLKIRTEQWLSSWWRNWGGGVLKEFFYCMISTTTLESKTGPKYF